jgi:hypothetical protein
MDPQLLISLTALVVQHTLPVGGTGPAALVIVVTAAPIAAAVSSSIQFLNRIERCGIEQIAEIHHSVRSTQAVTKLLQLLSELCQHPALAVLIPVVHGLAEKSTVLAAAAAAAGDKVHILLHL